MDNNKPNPNYVPPASVKKDILKPCPLCGKEMHETEIHLCGGTPTLIHTCVNDIQIKIQGNTKSDVIRKWTAFVTIANK